MRDSTVADLGMPVVVHRQVHGPDRAVGRQVSTVANLGQGYLTCWSLCNDTCPWSYRADARGDSTVADHEHARCCSTTGVHGPDRAEARGDSTVADFETRYPQGRLCRSLWRFYICRSWTKFVKCPSLYNDRCPRS